MKIKKIEYFVLDENGKEVNTIFFTPNKGSEPTFGKPEEVKEKAVGLILTILKIEEEELGLEHNHDKKQGVLKVTTTTKGKYYF